MWEAFIEDLAAEVLQHFAMHAESADQLPLPLRKSIAKRIVREKNELAPWSVAGDGWRQLLRASAARLSHADDQTLSSPASYKVEKFFEEQTGIVDLASSWRWAGTGSQKSCARLDKFVALRNAIAHRGGPQATSVTRANAQYYLRLIEKMAEKSAAHVNDVVWQHVGVRLISDPIEVELPTA